MGLLLQTAMVLAVAAGGAQAVLPARVAGASAKIADPPAACSEGSASQTVAAVSSGKAGEMAGSSAPGTTAEPNGNARAAAETPSAPFSTHLAGFQVRIRKDVNPYDVLGVYVLPGEVLPLEILSESSSARFQVTAAEGETLQIDARVWQWTAPAKTGLYPVEVARADTGARMTLNVFVMVPRERIHGGKLNGYDMGGYPEIPLRGLPVYLPPAGFVEVTPGNRKTLVGPHFRLEQFLCKQSGGPPRYVVLREPFLLKLEALLQEVNARGHRCDSFHIMSGYRTPRYNAAIGNVRYSRHQYGDAADLFIDESPRDGVMDDLDGNDRIDLNDAGILHDIIEQFDMDPANSIFLGGLGKYGATSSHGPFVHTDVRGFRARW